MLPIGSFSKITTATAPSFPTLPGSFASLVAFGDSITVGQGASDSAHNWVSLTCAALGATQDNQGISGTVFQDSNDAGGSPRANNGRDRFGTALLGTNQKALCVIDYGFNDMRYTAAPSTMNLTNFTTQYKEMLNGLLLGGYTADQILIATPYYMTAQGYNTGSSGFSGSNSTINLSYGSAVQAASIEYGLFFADPYAAMASNGAGSLIGPDNIHPNDAGYAVISTCMLAAAKTTLLTQVAGLAVSSPGSGQLQVDFTAKASAVSYDVQAGISGLGTYEFTSTANVGTNTQTFSGLGPGAYVARVRANFANGTSTPWAFYTTPVTVTVTGVPTVDGSATNSTGGVSGTVTLSTTKTNDIIVLVSIALGTGGTISVASVSDTAGLTWAKRNSVSFASGNDSFEIWWAFSSGILTNDVITVTGSAGTTNFRNTAFGVNGANTTTPFDTDVSLPAGVAGTSATTLSRTISTTHAKDLLIAAVRSTASLGTVTRPATFSQVINAGTNEDVSVLGVSSTQSSQAITYSWTGATSASAILVDAIQGA